jgi:molecular chaperone GrpE (heat shock protein)
MRSAIAQYPEQLSVLSKSLEKTLLDLGLEVFGEKTGVVFNPEEAEAIEVKGEGEKEIVGEVVRVGYKFQKQLLRPAMVKVIRK